MFNAYSAKELLRGRTASGTPTVPLVTPSKTSLRSESALLQAVQIVELRGLYTCQATDLYQPG